MLPSSTVSVMSNEEDQCYQCEELGHIAHYCPNVHCFECYEYGHIVADCPDRIPPSGTPAHCHRQNPTPGIAPDQLLDAITGTSTGTADHSHNPSHADIKVIVISTPTEAILGHIIEIVDATIEALHTATTVLITFAMTHHIKDHPHVKGPPLIPEITADPDHVLHINQVRELCINLHPVLTEPQ